MRHWKHNLNSPEPPLRNTSLSHRLSGRVVTLVGGYFAAGKIWTSKAEAEMAASKLAAEADLIKSRKR